MATSSTTSSPGSGAGRSRSGSRAGPRTGRSGPAPAPASRSLQRASGRERKMSDTSGPTGSRSSPSADLQRSLESRLRARLGASGSPEYALTWRRWDMPSGPPICALRASARRTSGKGFGGWPTPKAQRPEQVTHYKRGNPTLGAVAQMAGWATPRVSDKAAGRRLNKEGKRVSASGIYGVNLSDQATLASGLPSISSPAPTRKCGALNPSLSRWLMGFPRAWDEYAPASSPKLKRR